MSARVMLKFTAIIGFDPTPQECWIPIADIRVIKTRPDAGESRLKATIVCKNDDVYNTTETASALAAFIDSERL